MRNEDILHSKFNPKERIVFFHTETKPLSWYWTNQEWQYIMLPNNVNCRCSKMILFLFIKALCLRVYLTAQLICSRSTIHNCVSSSLMCQSGDLKYYQNKPYVDIKITNNENDYVLMKVRITFSPYFHINRSRVFYESRCRCYRCIKRTRIETLYTMKFRVRWWFISLYNGIGSMQSVMDNNTKRVISLRIVSSQYHELIIVEPALSRKWARKMSTSQKCS